MSVLSPIVLLVHQFSVESLKHYYTNLILHPKSLMEDYSRYSMEKTVWIIKRSIYTFLQKYQCLTTTATLLTFPFAESVLLAKASVPSFSLIQVVHNLLQSLFDVVGFLRSSNFFTILNLRLSQTIATSFLVFPFAFTFLLFAKAFIIQVLCNHKSTSQAAITSILLLYSSLFVTQLCNMLIIISANATCFCLLFFAFNCVNELGLLNSKSLILFSAIGVVLYSINLANALIICNLGLILSGMENCGGYIVILKACVLIRGRTATVVALALLINMVLVAIKTLFSYHIIRAYYDARTCISSMAFDEMFIAYLYLVLLILDTVVGYVFYKSCKAST